MAVCVRAGIVRVSVGLLGGYRSFFIIGGIDCLFLRLRDDLLLALVGFARNLLRGNQKTKLQSHPNSVFFPSNNEKRTPQAQRNLLKRERFQPEHTAPKHHVEVGITDLHRIQAANIPVHRGSQNAPPQRIPRGEELESS